MPIFDNIFQLMFTIMAFMFLIAAFTSLWEGMKWTAAMCAATSFCIAASVSLAMQVVS